MSRSPSSASAAPVRSLTQSVGEAIDEESRAYAPSEDRPLGGYVALLGAYAATTAVSALAVRTLRHQLPERIETRDLVLLGVATHKVSRLLAKGSVTSPLRAPLTRFEGRSGPSEIAERPRRSGILHALGELVSCPFCIDQWVGSAFVTGLLVAPRLTRIVASGMSVVAASDALHIAHDAAHSGAQAIRPG